MKQALNNALPRRSCGLFLRNLRDKIEMETHNTHTQRHTHTHPSPKHIKNRLCETETGFVPTELGDCK